MRHSTALSQQIKPYLVNKSLLAAGISVDNAKAENCPQNEKLAEKRSFEGNCEILKVLFSLLFSLQKKKNNLILQP